MRIQKYRIKEEPSPEDYLIGTDGVTGETINIETVDLIKNNIGTVGLRTMVKGDEKYDSLSVPDLDITKLFLTIDNWDKIKNYNPVLLIDRYKKKNYNGDVKKLSGFKHETMPDKMNRINELNITEKLSEINFNPESYFNFAEDRAWGIVNSNLETLTDGMVIAYVLLGFRLRLTIEGKIIETPVLNKMKMYYGYKDDTKTSKIIYYKFL